MRAIVTGATGFVGKELVRELTSNGIDVLAIVRNSKKIPEAWKNTAQIQLLYGDLHKLDEIDISSIKDVEYFNPWQLSVGKDRRRKKPMSFYNL